MKKLSFCLLAIFSLVACKKNNDYLPPDFNYEIEPVAISENVTVGAYYHSYAAADWSKKYTNSPTLGEYSALTPAIMEQHRKWADQGGIDFFVFTWNGTSGNGLLNSFVQGRTNQVKMVVNYNMAHLSATNASPLVGAKLNTLINEFKTLNASHFSKDYYYKINGRPVVTISSLNLSASAATSIDYATVIPALKDAIKQVGVELYLIGEISSGWLPPQRYTDAVKAMDGVTLKDWSTDNYDRSQFFHSFNDMNWQNWTASTSNWNMDFIPCIYPAFNDKKMTPASKKYDMAGSNFYATYCNVAKKNMGKARLILVNSWNNFQLGTALEPTQETGTDYLTITRQQFKIN